MICRLLCMLITGILFCHAGYAASLLSDAMWRAQGIPEVAAIRKEADGTVLFRFTPRPGRTDSAGMVQILRSLKPGKRFVFSGQVRTEGRLQAFLQVTFRKNGRTVGWESSIPAWSKDFQPLHLEFESRADADEVLLQCYGISRRTPGGTAEFRDLKCCEKEAAPPGLRLTATLECGSVYLSGVRAKSSADFQMKVRFREKPGTEWREGPDLVLIPDEGQARTSLFGLKPDTVYAVEVSGSDAGENRSFRGELRTWQASPPVAETIRLRAADFSGQLVITGSGRPDGWIRYTAEPGTVLEGGPDADAVIRVLGARYILLENLTVRGGRRYGVELTGGDHVRIVNCDISGFGRRGRQLPGKDGKFYLDNEVVNYDTGIFINHTSNLLIERCCIHAPRGTANPWFFSHPAGPSAIFVKGAGGTVIRYNDLIGSDGHRWNDVIEGFNNGSVLGGFNCDADVYGNFMAFSNDDGIEFDGGQMNCRFFDNRVEGTFCGISLAPCLKGPSFVFRNLFINPGDVAGARSAVIKNGFNMLPKGKLHIYSNTARGRWVAGFSSYGGKKPAPGYQQECKGVVLNNFFEAAFGVDSYVYCARHLFDYNLYADCGQTSWRDIHRQKGQDVHGVFRTFQPGAERPRTGQALPVAGFSLPAEIGCGTDIPRREVPFRLNVSEIRFRKDGNAVQTIRLEPRPGADGAFRVVQVQSPLFFRVTPEQGRFRSGQTVNLKIELSAARREKRFFRGAFTVRDAQGASRAVSVYADCRDFQANRSGIIIDRFAGGEQFESVNGPIPGKKAFRLAGSRKCLTADFHVPEDGAYFLFARIRGIGYSSVDFSLDNGPFRKSAFYICSGEWEISPAANNERGSFFSGPPNQPFSLKKGNHTLSARPRNPVDLDAFYFVPADSLKDYLKIPMGGEDGI